MVSPSVSGLKLLGITEHTHNMPGTCDDLYFVNLRVVPREMFGVRLMLGAELNIMDEHGTVDLPDWIIDKTDLRIASIHGNLFAPGTRERNTAAVLGAMKNPKIDMIGHPDDGNCPLDYALPCSHNAKPNCHTVPRSKIANSAAHTSPGTVNSVFPLLPVMTAPFSFSESTGSKSIQRHG